MTTTPLPGGVLKRKPDPGEIEAMLDEGGPFDRHQYPGFSHRPGQKKMLQATARTLADAQLENLGIHLSVEGGTGIGKSLAYLIPSVLYAATTNSTVVVTTNTINLQDQLVEHDIPQVVRVLELEGILNPGMLRHQTLKGEGNYLCSHRWENAVADGTDAYDTLKGVIPQWRTNTATGDLAELTVTSAQRQAWEQVCARRPKACPHYRKPLPQCFLYRARRAAQTAHILVVNHALYLNTINRGSGTIPHHEVVIIDEAHRLADEASRQLGAETSQQELNSIQSEIDEWLQSPDSPIIDMASTHWEMAWDGLRQLMDQEGADHENGTTLDLNGPMTPEWQAVINDWHEFAATSLLNLSRWLRVNAREQRTLFNMNAEDVIGRLADAVDEIKQKGDLFFSHEPGHIRVARSHGQHETISATPLQVAPHLQDLIFNDSRSAVLTSATLAPNGDFLPTQRELGISPHQPTSICESPFHYREQAMLLSPRDLPNPSRDGPSHEAAVQQTLLALAKSLGGRTLALFTSRSAMNRAAKSLADSLKTAGIGLIVQGQDGSASQVARRMTQQPRSLAMGVDSMWEGLDLPPHALCAVAVCRLPFPVPSDPVIKARSELYLEPFQEYYLPKAVRRFRQGCGRLIRSDQSRGVIVVLDPRIRNNRYGKKFWQALPPLDMAKSTLDDVAQIAAEFVERPHTAANGA